MSISSMVKSRLAEYISSEGRLLRNRNAFEKQRKRTGAAHLVHYFHCAADPYAHMTLQVLGEFQRRYAVTVVPHLISGPPAWAVPDRKGLESYALVDSMRLAKRYRLLEAGLKTPDLECITKAEAWMAGELGSEDFIDKLLEISCTLWSGANIQSGDTHRAMQEKEKGDALLAKWGHYLGATFYYGGEWYWGIDRLHYLEERLQILGLGKKIKAITPPILDILPTTSATSDEKVDFFISFRSPYSYLAFDRTCNLIQKLGVGLNIRPVLPMVMRGLAVPAAKKKYIFADSAREARLHGIPFGKVCDPLGKAIERGYSLLAYAESNGRLAEYCSAFMAGVWSEGVNASTNQGLARIVAHAQLNWREAQEIVDNNDWRDQIETNQKALIAQGLWGVPSFKVGDTAIWGQDRLWVLKQAF